MKTILLFASFILISNWSFNQVESKEAKKELIKADKEAIKADEATLVEDEKTLAADDEEMAKAKAAKDKAAFI